MMLNVTCYGVHRFDESILSPEMEENLTLITIFLNIQLIHRLNYKIKNETLQKKITECLGGQGLGKMSLEMTTKNMIDKIKD